MKHCTAVGFAIVVALALTWHQTAAAGPVWALDWPVGLTTTQFLTPGGRTELDITFTNLVGNAQSSSGTIAELAISDHGTGPLTSGTITKQYAFNLRLIDLASGAVDLLRFSGYLRADFSPKRTTIENVLTSPVTVSGIQLGDNIYTISLGPFSPPDISGQILGSLGATVTYQPATAMTPEAGSGRPPVSSTPEPSSLLLGVLGFGVLGVAMRKKSRVEV